MQNIASSLTRYMQNGAAALIRDQGHGRDAKRPFATESGWKIEEPAELSAVFILVIVPSTPNFSKLV